jgi:hypothetical protein|tara:strand:+ start:1565 stop:2542 length:978 start_codon:yes stop_codon:yes gene_type:complete
MSGILNFLLFIIVLVIYIHIINQLKTSEDLEVYEMDYTNNQYLQEVCNIKQPVLFESSEVMSEFFEQINSETFKNNDSYDIKVKDIRDYYKDESVDYIVLPVSSATNLMKSDTRSSYFTENNEEFIENADLYHIFHSNDTHLKPPLSMITKYDIMTGSTKTVTPLRYHTDFRKFMSVHSGKVKIKMTPWKSHKYLLPHRDFENYDFRSRINVWNPDKKHKNEVDKLRFLEFEITPGNTLHIPPHWWYSIQFNDDSDTIVTSITYNSIMNCVSNLPNWGLYFLQQTNTKTKITKTLPIEISDENKNESDKEVEPTENTDTPMTQEI